MSSILQSFQKRSTSLPLSQGGGPESEQGLRRRLSSLSLKIQPIASPATSWAYHRSKSVSSMGEGAASSLRKWWEWGWSWILSRKPVFAKDVEMNEEESNAVGWHNKGSWRRVLYKVRSEFRKIVRSEKVGLPQTYSYDSLSYSKNFENGMKIQE